MTGGFGVNIAVESDIEVIPGRGYESGSDVVTTPPQNDVTLAAAVDRNQTGTSTSGRHRPDGQDCPSHEMCVEIDRPQCSGPARVWFSPDVVPVTLSERQEDESVEEEADNGLEDDWNDEWEDDWGEDLDEDWDDNWEDDLDEMDEDDEDWDEEPAGPVDPEVL